jgi:hypothetical protein
MSRTFLKAAPGLRIRQADGQPWPEAGEYADTTDIYIQRRMADCDLVAADAPAGDRPGVAAGDRHEGPSRPRTNKNEEPAR